jgi:hypothetical protein
MNSVDELLHRIEARPWWVDSVALVAVAVVSVGASLVFSPYEGERVSAFGIPFPGACAFLEWTGIPCTQCGMTRSWVHAARGNFMASLTYNPAGATLFAAIVYGGVLGVLRLLRRNARALEMPDRWLYTLVATWAGILWIGAWLARVLWNVNPLP